MDERRFTTLLQTLMTRGYSFRSFDETEGTEGSRTPGVVLRHDVDLSPAHALEMATWETALGVRASYFFLVTSGLYNVQSRECRDVIARINDLGHAVGLHFDGAVYEAPALADVQREKDALGPLNVLDIVSLHRPPKNTDVLGQLRERLAVRTTYDDEWFSERTYLSDSRGECDWLLSEADRLSDGRDLQLLIHPLWWVAPGVSAQEKLRHFVAQAAGDRYETLCEEVMPEARDLPV